MAKIMELYQMRLRVEEACRAFRSLDRELAKISLTPGDSAGLEAAMRKMEAAIDRKAAPFRGNKFVDPLREAAERQILPRRSAPKAAGEANRARREKHRAPPSPRQRGRWPAEPTGWGGESGSATAGS